MKTLKFYKEVNDWFVDLPEWEGSKAELQMVAGADTMLEYMAEGEDSVRICLAINRFSNADKLDFIKLADEIGNGAYYKLQTYRGLDLNLDMWLCDVTKFVFGMFPQTIYLQKV